MSLLSPKDCKRREKAAERKTLNWPLQRRPFVVALVENVPLNLSQRRGREYSLAQRDAEERRCVEAKKKIEALLLFFFLIFWMSLQLLGPTVKPWWLP